MPKTGKFLGKKFQMGRGLTQGDPVSPMICNIVVDAVLQALLDVVCRPQEYQHGFRWAAGEKNLFFYDDGGRITGRDHEWFQDALSAMVTMFIRMGL